MKLLLNQMCILKWKVVHAVPYPEERVLRINQRVRVQHVVLVLVRQRRMKFRRAIHQDVTGTGAMAY